MWNNAEHLATYFAVPSMGAVLHTLNIWLAPEQLIYIATEAEDKVIIVDATLIPRLARMLPPRSSTWSWRWDRRWLPPSARRTPRWTRHRASPRTAGRQHSSGDRSVGSAPYCWA
jgi:acyl-CoA synthetase (AMP-forming)/AMP-acid ligase II